MTTMTIDELQALRRFDGKALRHRFRLSWRQARTLQRGIEAELRERLAKQKQDAIARKKAVAAEQARPTQAVGLGWQKEPDGTVYACWNGEKIMPLTDWQASKKDKLQHHLEWCDTERRGCLEMFAFVVQGNFNLFKFAGSFIDRTKYFQHCRRAAAILGIELQTVYEMTDCCRYSGLRIVRACIELARCRPYDAERMRRVDEHEATKEWQYVDEKSDVQREKEMQEMIEKETAAANR